MPSPASGRIESSLAVGADGVVRSVRGGRGERAVTADQTLARCGAGDQGPPPARPLLHAWRIEFDHPWTGARVVVECAPDEPELQP